MIEDPSLPKGPPLLCDFCSIPDPIWEYRAKDFTTERKQITPRTTLTLTSLASWLACWECSELIEQENFDGLIGRALDAAQQRSKQRTKQPLPADRRALIEDMLRASYMEFFKHRLGPRQPFKSGKDTA